MQDPTVLREQADKVVRSGALGRSRSYARLLEFLVSCAIEGRTPKELEIAVKVFGKGADFDPSQDSMVRVYAHNLRQKLEHYYATQGRDDPRPLALARGEYRISIASPEPAAVDPALAQHASPEGGAPLAAERNSVRPQPPARTAVSRAGAWRAIGAAAVLAAGIALGFALDRSPPPAVNPYAAVAASPVWAQLFDDNLPVLLVVGDYYIVGEVDGNGDVFRLVRSFEINSSRDLDERLMNDPEAFGRYLDLDLTYLPRGSAFAMLDLLRVLYTAQKPVRAVAVSELHAADLKASHVVYIGYLSGLGMLEDFVFASSGLSIGDTYDELLDQTSGAFYTSEAGMPGIERNYRDYAFLSTFPGPGGNQFIVVAGTRDAGLMQAAHTLADPTLIRNVEQARPDGGSAAAPAFEVLFEVTGYGRTNLDAMLVHSGKLNYQEIWGGNLLTVD